MLYASACFSLLHLLLAAVGTYAAAIDSLLSAPLPVGPTPTAASPSPSLASPAATASSQPQSPSPSPFILQAYSKYGSTYGKVEQAHSGIWTVVWTRSKGQATPARLDPETRLQFNVSQTSMYLTFDNSTASVGVLFAEVTAHGGVTGLYLVDNKTLAWRGGKQTEVGWMSCIMVDRRQRLFFYDEILISPPQACFHIQVSAIPVTGMTDGSADGGAESSSDENVGGGGGSSGVDSSPKKSNGMKAQIEVVGSS